MFLKFIHFIKASGLSLLSFFFRFFLFFSHTHFLSHSFSVSFDVLFKMFHSRRSSLSLTLSEMAVLLMRWFNCSLLALHVTCISTIITEMESTHFIPSHSSSSSSSFSLLLLLSFLVFFFLLKSSRLLWQYSLLSFFSRFLPPFQVWRGCVHVVWVQGWILVFLSSCV